MVSKNEENISKELGEKLRAAREKTGLTQAEVAKASGLSSNYYARIERGDANPSYQKLQGILKALKIKSLSV